MRILVVHSELGLLRGGGENFTKNLFAAFAARGHRVAAVFAADRNGNYAFPLPLGIEPIPVPGWWPMALGETMLSFVGRHLPSDSSLQKQWDRVREAISWRTFRWYRNRFQRRIEHEWARYSKNIDAVYVHGNAALASRVARYHPTVLRLPGPLSHEAAPLLRSVHAVCANGDALVRIRSFLGEHAVEIPVGLDRDLFQPDGPSVRNALGWTDHDFVIGYVGRLIHLKGVDLLAEAFREMAQKTSNLRLLIVGSGDEERSIRSVLGKEFARGVVYHQPDVSHDQLPDWYRAMDLLVMPSRYENFSNTILEALACGVPFLGSDVGGNRMLAEGGAGWLFERGSVSSLVHMLQKASRKSAEMKVKSQAASSDIRNRYNWEKSAEVLESILTSRLGVQR